MTDKIKSCPFCGGEAGYTNAQLPNGTEVYYIECLECGASSAVYGTIERAVKDWNTRKPMDRIVEHLRKRKLYYESAYKIYEGGTFAHIYKIQAKTYNKAIEIVKEGGKDE